MVVLPPPAPDVALLLEANIAALALASQDEGSPAQPR